jgi:hypothetical protein
MSLDTFNFFSHGCRPYLLRGVLIDGHEPLLLPADFGRLQAQSDHLDLTCSTDLELLKFEDVVNSILRLQPLALGPRWTEVGERPASFRDRRRRMQACTLV